MNRIAIVLSANLEQIYQRLGPAFYWALPCPANSEFARSVWSSGEQRDDCITLMEERDEQALTETLEWMVEDALLHHGEVSQIMIFGAEGTPSVIEIMREFEYQLRSSASDQLTFVPLNSLR